jgi:hypothetical protein
MTINQRKNTQMKSNLIKYAVCAAMMLGMAATVQATQIAGAITFNGTVTLDTGNAANALGVTAWGDLSGLNQPQIASVGGDFVGLATPGHGVAFHAPWSFTTLVAIPSFWSVDGFTFALTSSALQFQGGNPAQAVVGGTGTISGNGFSATPASWSFSVGNPPAGTVNGNAIFSIRASNGTLPDGGTTVMLMGAALSGLALLRRKLA